MNSPHYVASSCSMCGVEFFDVASNCSTWRRTVRCDIEWFDVASNCSMLGIEQQVPSPAFPRPCCAPALLDPRTAKPSLGRLHFFAGDVKF